jgi:peptide/nickel transport system ATP-binding protein
VSGAAGALLEVRDLVVELGPREPRTRALDGVSFEVRPGETLGLIGASGSGKTTAALAVLGLLPGGARASGSVRWRGRELLGLPPAALREVRGAEIALVPQDPMGALHPLWRVDRQVAEAVRAHRPRTSRREALGRARALLERMGIPRSRLAESGYPFEWSGGMRQRALIAMAVANRPGLLIADEPTTALDATTQAAVLALLRQVQRESGAAMLLISHDAAVVRAMADRVVTMRDGRVVGPAPAGGEPAARPAPPPRPEPARLVAPRGEVLRVEGLRVRYRLRGRGWGRRAWLHAVENVGFELAPAETLAVVGASGSGKSSLARALVRLEEPAAGSVVLGGRDLTRLAGPALRRARAGIQIVFQDHTASLNPRRRVGASILEPLRAQGRLPRGGGEGRAAELLEAVGLPAAFADRLPYQLSGGERQRVAIARALALRPQVLVLDEPVTSLDADARGAILRLLRDLQAEHGIAYLLIAHDLRLVRDVAHRTAVMQDGRFVEIGETAALFTAPAHPCTRRLLATLADVVEPVPPGA